MRMKLLMLLFILLFVMGCATFGIKKDKSECDQILESDGTLRATTDGEKVSCYRELAVSLAWISNANDAKDVCNDIRHLGISNPDIQSTKSLEFNSTMELNSSSGMSFSSTSTSIKLKLKFL